MVDNGLVTEAGGDPSAGYEKRATLVRRAMNDPSDPRRGAVAVAQRRSPPRRRDRERPGAVGSLPGPRVRLIAASTTPECGRRSPSRPESSLRSSRAVSLGDSHAAGADDDRVVAPRLRAPPCARARWRVSAGGAPRRAGELGRTPGGALTVASLPRTTRHGEMSSTDRGRGGRSSSPARRPRRTPRSACGTRFRRSR